MEAREFLEQVGKVEHLIENKLIEKEQWRSVATNTSAKIGGERVQSSSSQHKMEDAVVKIVQIENEIDEQVKHLVDIKQEVICTIEKLEASSYDILHKRYIQGIQLYEISIANNKTLSSIKRKHGKALKQLQTLINDRENN